MFVASFLWRDPSLVSPPVYINLGHVENFAVNDPQFFPAQNVWLVKKVDGTFLAMYAKDPHLGCKDVWRPDFWSTDPQTGMNTKGWFRDPCYGATYDIY